jgi:hypothetical protein
MKAYPQKFITKPPKTMNMTHVPSLRTSAILAALACVALAGCSKPADTTAPATPAAATDSSATATAAAAAVTPTPTTAMAAPTPTATPTPTPTPTPTSAQ